MIHEHVLTAVYYITVSWDRMNGPSDFSPFAPLETLRGPDLPIVCLSLMEALQTRGENDLLLPMYLDS